LAGLRGLAAVILLLLGCAPSASVSPPAASSTTAAPPGQPAAQPGAARPSSVVDLAAYQGADRQQLLEEGARREGTLTWYTSLAGPIIERLFADFKAKYPYLQTELYRGSETDLTTRATQEAQAGQPLMDVIESPISAIRLLFDAGLLVPYYTPSVASFPDAYKTPANDGLIDSATDRIQFISFGYNTQLVPESAVPKTLDDLLNPGLTDKLGLTGTTTGSRWAGSVLEAMGPERGQQFLARLGSQQHPRTYQVSGTALAELVAKGEVPASPNVFQADVQRLAREQDAPVRWVPLEPVLGNAGQVALAAKAPHPHAALLFVDYLLGDGQQVLADNGYHTASQQVPFKLWIPEQGRTAAQIESDADRWQELFRGINRS
jgi:iron(III) transport system substrate-binding protein